MGESWLMGLVDWRHHLVEKWVVCLAFPNVRFIIGFPTLIKGATFCEPKVFAGTFCHQILGNLLG